MRARQPADLARERADFIGAAAIGADAFLEDLFANDLFLELLKDRLHFVRRMVRRLDAFRAVGLERVLVDRVDRLVAGLLFGDAFGRLQAVLKLGVNFGFKLLVGFRRHPGAGGAGAGFELG